MSEYYKVLYGQSGDGSLEHLVSNAIAKGWMPAGGVFTSGPHLAQAMFRQPNQTTQTDVAPVCPRCSGSMVKTFIECHNYGEWMCVFTCTCYHPDEVAFKSEQQGLYVDRS